MSFRRMQQTCRRAADPVRRRRRRWTLSLGSLAVVSVLGGAVSSPASAGSQQTFSTAQIKTAVDGAYKTFSAKLFVPGMAIGVVAPNGDGVMSAHTYVFGYANLAAGQRVTPRTQFEIGSETKTFTAALLAQAVEDELVTLSEPVQNVLPATVTAPDGVCAVSPFYHRLVPFTFANLATHTSGLPDDPPGYPDTSTGHADYTPAQLFKALEKTTLAFCPGTSWLYSDFGFGLLGTVLADDVWKPPTTYASLIQAQITAPLGMTETMLEAPTAELATGYLHRCYVSGGSPLCVKPPPHPKCPCFTREHPRSSQHARLLGVVATPWDNTGAMAGGGGLISSITDMERYVRAELGQGPAATVATLEMTEQPLAGYPGQNSRWEMGLAWQVNPHETGLPGNLLFKNGATKGMSSATMLLPSAQVGVTVLSNSVTDAPEDVAANILQTLFGVPAPTW